MRYEVDIDPDDTSGPFAADEFDGGGSRRNFLAAAHRYKFPALVISCGLAGALAAACVASARSSVPGDSSPGLSRSGHAAQPESQQEAHREDAAAEGASRAPVPGPVPGAVLAHGPTPRGEAEPRLRGRAQLWQTVRQYGHPLEQQEDALFVADFDFVGPVVDVARQDVGQTLEGFGGAFTEASATTFFKLSEELQQKTIDGYFGPEGLGYTLGRVHINSCDFAKGSYSFDEWEDDWELKHFDFSVKRDAEALIPFIRRAQDALAARGGGLRLLATPWSPPAWMKNNAEMDHSLQPCLRAEAPDPWARYMSKWITAYKASGVPIWALTVQNEPENDAAWEACLMTPEDEADFLGYHLGPAIREEHPEVLIFVYDHNKDNLYRWAKAIYSHPTAAQHTAGVAFHWYAGDRFDEVARVHTDFPQAMLLASEATYERYRWRVGTALESGEWAFGEGYAHDIIGDLNAGAVGWIDWNLLLDQTGGPNHANNVCDAAVVADVTEGTLFQHPQYHYIGHFSKYIPAGSQHLRTKVAPASAYTGNVREYGTCTGQDGLEAVSFLRPDGLIAIVVLNCGDHIIGFKLREDARASLARIPPHAIQTYLLESS